MLRQQGRHHCGTPLQHVPFNEPYHARRPASTACRQQRGCQQVPDTRPQLQAPEPHTAMTPRRALGRHGHYAAVVRHPPSRRHHSLEGWQQYPQHSVHDGCNNKTTRKAADHELPTLHMVLSRALSPVVLTCCWLLAGKHLWSVPVNAAHTGLLCHQHAVPTAHAWGLPEAPERTACAPSCCNTSRMLAGHPAARAAMGQLTRSRPAAISAAHVLQRLSPAVLSQSRCSRRRRPAPAAPASAAPGP